MAATPEAEVEAVSPGAFGFQNAPAFLLSDLTNSGEGIDESLLLTELKEREVGAGIAETGKAGSDFEFLQATDFFVALVVFPDHFGKEFNPRAPVESRAETFVKSERIADAFDPELGAGRGKNEVAATLFVVGDFREDFRIGELREPIGKETIDVFLQF